MILLECHAFVVKMEIKSELEETMEVWKKYKKLLNEEND